MNSPAQDKAPLLAALTAELSRPQSAAIAAAARACGDRFGDSTVALLFYGSCLRTGEVEDKILDFYVIVDDYRKAYDHFGLALANSVLPPNVFYSEIEFEGQVLRSKFAVLSIDDFCARCTDNCLNVSIWARFCQPSVLISPHIQPINDRVVERLTRAMGDACVTMLANAYGKATPSDQADDLWTTAFDLTYGAELRSEKVGKGQELFQLDQARYQALTPLIIPLIDKMKYQKHNGWRWFWRRVNGKIVSFLRLIKATFTFDGGVDYLAWKITRHSGVTVEIEPWQRRHPILGGLFLFIRLRRRGAFR